MELHTNSILFPIRFIYLRTDGTHELMAAALDAGISLAPMEEYAIFSMPISAGLL